jgi:hypothetical protein
MPESKRQCSTCKFFQNAQLSGNGWCTHPKRQVASDVKILVRERELACRNTWGDDLWIDALSNATTPTAPSPRREFTYINTKLEDEVTSVVDSGAVARPTSASHDDVVTFTSVRRDESASTPDNSSQDVNTAAVADQEERARQMARGSRHAIDSARQRHTRRWTPAKSEDEVMPGGAKQVEPAITDDQVITAQHRGTQSDQAAIQEDWLDTTGPVPRAEIEAHGALPPLPDSEPDETPSAPRVSASVDLPRLRSFLRPDEAIANTLLTSEHPGTSPAHPAASSNFEHVMRQAERIKALSKSERATQTRPTATPVRRPVVQAELTATTPRRPNRPEPEPAGDLDLVDEVSTRADDVVPETDDRELNTTIARARAAIEQRPAVTAADSEPQESWQEPVFESDVEPQPRGLVANTNLRALSSEPNFEPPLEESLEPEFEAAAEKSFDEDLIVDEMEPLDAWEYDEPWDDEPVPQIAAEAYEPYAERTVPRSRQESPRGSWWRSLNFSLRRRYEPEPEPVYEYEEDDVGPYPAPAAQEPAHSHADAVKSEQFEDDRLYWEDAPLEPVAEDAWWPEDAVEDEDVQDDLPLAATRTGSDSYLATTDESWHLDAREFPEPQPASWHATRSEILARRPEPQPAQLDRRERQAPVADEVEWIDPPAASRQREEQPARRPRPEPREFIPIDQPNGMDAFRSALFGSVAPVGLNPAEQFAQPTPPPTAIDDLYRRRERSSYTEFALPVADPEPEDWDEPAYEPVAARQAAPERTPRRQPRRNRSGKGSRHVEQDVDDLFDIRRAVADPDDTSVTRQLAVENGVAKCCLTCRSFQPADEAGRGWCLSEWSTTHRQMVNADTLACQSSIGNWWIAADTTWIPPADSIQPQTPRADRLIARAETRDGKEPSRRSRVRTGKVG